MGAATLGGSTLQCLLARTVDMTRKRAWVVVLGGVLLAIGAGVYADRHLGLDTNTDEMFSASLPWRRRQIAFDRDFPQFQGLLVAVIDARVPEEAEATARGLAHALASDHAHFSRVSRPGASPYFAREGLLFLSAKDLVRLLNRIIDAQPFLGELAQDPTARGLFSALGLLGKGVTRSDTNLAPYAPELLAFHNAMAGALAGHARFLSWQRMLSRGGFQFRQAVSTRARQAAPRLPRT